MNDIEKNQFFTYLWEIWRDITVIEFLMRCAIAKQDNDIHKFPKPPYVKGKIYKEYPQSFSDPSFKNITKKFNECFPKLSIPSEVVNFRNAMAHGIISEINISWVNELVKFKQKKDKSLMVEFGMSLELEKLAQLRQSLNELRGYIMKELD